jgi:hypothetical protein
MDWSEFLEVTTADRGGVFGIDVDLVDRLPVREDQWLVTMEPA